MASSPVRTRFAPSPTGFMHLGNVRSALINYLFAHHAGGTFILRIEDTDAERNVDPAGKNIMMDLAWLGLQYTEGPGVGGPHEPYYQSQRTHLYTEALNKLIAQQSAYRCFCTTEELEKKRQRQQALKQPPRYDRTCAALPEAAIREKLAQNVPFIWRFAINQDTSVVVHDLARGQVTYDLKHFADFPLTRQDGSFTFIFANCIDDIAMGITHVFRGEEHFSNTGSQAALYTALGSPIPTFWHLQLICNKDGKKLSKRDFGFSLSDLRGEGYLPEAICNYLAMIGSSFTNNVMSLADLAGSLNVSHHASTGHIQYDPEQLRWMNHAWIMRLELADFTRHARPFIEARHPAAAHLNDQELEALTKFVQQECTTLAQAAQLLTFMFEEPEYDREMAKAHGFEIVKPFMQEILSAHSTAIACLEKGAAHAKQMGVPSKQLYGMVRMALTGKPEGASVKDLIAMLGSERAMARMKKFFA